MKYFGKILFLVGILAITPAVFAADSEMETQPAKTEVNTVQDNGVPAGYRGVTVTLPGDQLLFINKGDFIDITVTFQAVMKNDKKELVTATILQNVKVINILKPESPFGQGMIQVLLNPNEAQYLELSVVQAKHIGITLRSTGDKELHPMEIASFKKLIK